MTTSICDQMGKYIRKLSPSRIDTLTNCTWSYWCNYHLKLPDEGNDGSRRGSIIHDLYECLIVHIDRHKWKFEAMLEAQDVYEVPCIERFIRMKAHHYGLVLDAFVVTKNRAGLISNRQYLNDMILLGLAADFYGAENSEKIIAEQAHTLDVDDPERDVRYVVRGFIDKTFLREYVDGEPTEAEIVDYKSSKMKFSGDKIKFNMQGVVYQMFVKDLFPTVKNLKMSFLFLQFPRSPWQLVQPVEDKYIYGIELYLTELFKRINNFTEEDAKSHFAKHHGMSMFCGGRGCKSIKDKILGNVPVQEKKWMCPYKEPYDYYALTDEKGRVVSAHKNEKALEEKGELKIIKRRYKGCPSHFAQTEDIKKFWGEVK